MPDKVLRMQLAQHHSPRRPVMLAIAGDSAAGKTTLTRGLIDALGPERSTWMCVDDYHRYDREERKTLPFTALHPDGNYLEIIEQHLQLLASGRPVLKPVYDHATGELVRPQLVEPRDVVIVEGLFPLHSTSPGPASTWPSTSIRRRRSVGSGRSAGTRAGVATAPTR